MTFKNGYEFAIKMLLASIYDRCNYWGGFPSYLRKEFHFEIQRAAVRTVFFEGLTKNKRAAQISSHHFSEIEMCKMCKIVKKEKTIFG